ncbi:MAG TPA: potassium transporter TrkG [Candidatus Sulfotelmatobacter sp.]|nr:potassium transporter TrkG [Candidatus Sulfotelmatobacter sp.]
MTSLRRVVANLGFFLQITGLLLILPIAIGLHNGEIEAVSSLVATCFISFAAGFLFNSFCERKELDDKTSLWLMLATFILIPLLLTLPFIWNNVFNSTNPFDLFTNAYFETISGFTTTGFSFVINPSVLPSSLLFYRSLVQFIGGIGFIYILAAFLYPNESLRDYAQTFGVEDLGTNLKRVFISIMLIYTVFVAIFTGIFYIVYSPNSLIVASCAAIDVLTGGYQPNVAAGIGVFQVSILVLMLLGSFNFQFHYNLFRLNIRELITPEIKFYLELLIVSTILISILAWMNPFDSFFNVVSMASSTGIEFNISSSNAPVKVLFILIGLVGGCAFSMAGGIRIQRLKTVVNAVWRKGDEPSRDELKAVLISISGFVITLVILSLVFSGIGVSMIDSFFEIGSALTTNGISMGATNPLMPLGYKWLVILAMLIGRIEIVTIFAAIAGLPIFRSLRDWGLAPKEKIRWKRRFR